MRRLYAWVVALYPRSLRQEYGTDMKLLFAELLDDPAVSKRRIWSIILGDLAHMTRGVRIGALFGLLVVLTWLANRSIDIGPYDPPIAIGIGFIALLFAAAGFIGARHSGTIAGGIRVGLVAGLVSAITVPGEAWLFHNYFGDLRDFVFTYSIAAAIVMAVVIFGAELACLMEHKARARRGLHAFRAAWRDSELTT